MPSATKKQTAKNWQTAKKVFAVRWLTAKREVAPTNEPIRKNLTAPLFAGKDKKKRTAKAWPTAKAN